MRERMAESLKRAVSRRLVQYRCANGASVLDMAKLLDMTPRAYMDLERGAAACSAVTLARFLLCCCDDAAGFLKEISSAADAE